MGKGGFISSEVGQARHSESAKSSCVAAVTAEGNECVLRAEAEEVRECHTLAGRLAHNLIRMITAFTSFHRDGEKGESSARTARGHNRNGI